MSTFIQRSFAGGIVSSPMFGRSDLTKWQTGLKECTNFVISRAGAAVRRTGTRVIDVLSAASNVRLVPFVFADNQAYLLIFQDLTMQVVKDGVMVYDGASPYVLTTPYASADLKRLTFAQSGDVITVCHKGYEPREITRIADDDWTIATKTFGATALPPAGLTPATVGTDIYYTVTSIDSTTKEESAAATPVGSDSGIPNELTWTAATGAQEYNIYRSIYQSGGPYYYVGTSAGLSFRDPPLGTSAFITEDKSGTPPEVAGYFASADNYPGAVAYFQQRLVFGGSTNEPEAIWYSQTGLYNNFNSHFPLLSDDGATFTLAGNISFVRHFVEIGRLLCFTEGGVYILKGDSSGTLTATDPGPVRQNSDGIGDLPPIIVGTTVLYTQARGGIVRDLRYDLNTDGYEGNDLTVFATELFTDTSFNGWTYASIPYSVVWMAREDGTALGLTYMRDQNVAAWHTHTTDGTFLDMCAIPNGNFDRVYAAVMRNGNLYVEYFTQEYTGTDGIGHWYVDGGYLYEGTNAITQAPDSTISYSSGSAVSPQLSVTTVATVDQNTTVLADSAAFSADLVGSAVQVTDASGNVADILLTEFVSTTQMTGVPRVNMPSAFAAGYRSTWVLLTHRLTDLTALTSVSCVALCDGNPVEVTVDSSGVATFNRPYQTIIIGRPYYPILTTLGIEVVQGETLQGKPKNINQAIIKVRGTSVVWAGSSWDTLEESQPSALGDDDLPPLEITGDVVVHLDSNWTDTGTLTVSQIDPLPCTVLSVAYAAKVGG